MRWILGNTFRMPYFSLNEVKRWSSFDSITCNSSTIVSTIVDFRPPVILHVSLMITYKIHLSTNLKLFFWFLLTNRWNWFTFYAQSESAFSFLIARIISENKLLLCRNKTLEELHAFNIIKFFLFDNFLLCTDVFSNQRLTVMTEHVRLLSFLVPLFQRWKVLTERSLTAPEFVGKKKQTPKFLKFSALLLSEKPIAADLKQSHATFPSVCRTTSKP